MRRPRPPARIRPPDIARWAAGSHGIPYAWTFAAAAPGPHLCLNALIHGNEPCGAVALDALLRAGVRPRQGRLSFVFANVDAYARLDPADPDIARYVDEDMNRVWDDARLEGGADSAELRRARALAPLYADVDHLLDLHSMRHSSPPLMLAGMTDRALALARRVGVPAWIVRDQGHAAGPRLRDWGGFGAVGSCRTALLAECGAHWDPTSADVARATALRFLRAFDAIDPDLAAPEPAPPPPQAVVEVTHAVTAETPSFAFVAEFRGLERIARAGTVIAHDGGRPVATPYDDCVLVMPTRRLRPGLTAVRLGRLAA